MTEPHARGIVLFVDDEAAVRWIGRRCLEADGWTVLEAGDGMEALELISRLTGALDLVITDLTMPRVSGRELAEVLSVFRPGLPVLGITGFLSAVNLDRRLPILPEAVHCRQPAAGGAHGLRDLGETASPAEGESVAGAAAAGAGGVERGTSGGSGGRAGDAAWARGRLMPAPSRRRSLGQITPESRVVRNMGSHASRESHLASDQENSRALRNPNPAHFHQRAIHRRSTPGH